MNELMVFIKEIPYGLVYLFVALILLSVSRLTRDALTPYKINEELTEADNPALGLSLTGYYLAVIIVFIGVAYDPNNELYFYDAPLATFLYDLGLTTLYAILGIIFLNIAHYLTDRTVLHKFQTHKEVIEDRNAGTGAVEFANYVATGLIVAGALNGDSGGAWWFGVVTGTAFFVMAQIVLALFGIFYQLVTSYDIHAVIEQDNVPAGVALGGNMIAIAIIILKTISGDFTTWEGMILDLVIWSIAGFILLLALRWLIDLFFVPNATITEEIVNDRNINAAYMEGGLVIAMSMIIFFVL